ncbi:hypothetical protein BOX15_Mlig013819g1 [Macrostomum lignano]|uniref:Band 7 domain-containing protein n=1 Tax=Macrostomum lignano TaxID=282301 RepID=A0A267FST7_9PLAT|nr:hypothetical protein BOX15_Mlig013819g1 [Macrostomum lignano]
MAKGVSFSSDTRFKAAMHNGSGGLDGGSGGGSGDGGTGSDGGSGSGSDSEGSSESERLSRPTRQRLQRSFSLVPERLGRGFGGSLQSKRPMQFCELLMQALIGLLIAVTFPFSFFVCLKVIAQYERAVIFRLGRILSAEASGPGLVFIMPCMDSIKRVDLRTMTFDVPTQEVLTKDSVTVAVDAVVYYRIFDPVMSVVNVEDCSRSTKLLAQTTLRNVLGTVSLYELLAGRDDSAIVMQETLDAATDTWGVKVERVEIKDVRLPTQLQRAMAAEAEAAREARAKVIAAEGEQKASKALKLAALELSECNLALQLRYLQTLSSISAEKNSTIIFPLPLELLKFFQEAGGLPEVPLQQQQPQQQPQKPSSSGVGCGGHVSGGRATCARPVTVSSPSRVSRHALSAAGGYGSGC